MLIGGIDTQPCHTNWLFKFKFHDLLPFNEAWTSPRSKNLCINLNTSVILNDYGVESFNSSGSINSDHVIFSVFPSRCNQRSTLHVPNALHNNEATKQVCLTCTISYDTLYVIVNISSSLLSSTFLCQSLSIRFGL